MLNGIINVYKPTGMTSFDVVSIMRKLTGVRKIGHTGTLDPEAEGVLVLCVGEALKCVEYMMDKDKEYRAEITFGSSTDTQDATGTVLETTEHRIGAAELECVLQEFQGKQIQIPPVYSALKINGKKYCDIARAGKEPQKPPEGREIQIFHIELDQVILNQGAFVEKAYFRVHCSKGTYIRTLCHDIGIRTGGFAHMSALRRTKAGSFSLEQAYTILQLQTLAENARLETALLPPDTAFSSCRAVSFQEENIKRITNGIPVKLWKVDRRERIANPLMEELIRVYDSDGRFRAVGRVLPSAEGNLLKGYRIFTL